MIVNDALTVIPPQAYEWSRCENNSVRVVFEWNRCQQRTQATAPASKTAYGLQCNQDATPRILCARPSRSENNASSIRYQLPLPRDVTASLCKSCAQSTSIKAPRKCCRCHAILWRP